MVTGGIMRDEETFTRLEAPVLTVAGWSIHTPLVFERFNAPDVASGFIVHTSIYI